MEAFLKSSKSLPVNVKVSSVPCFTLALYGPSAYGSKGMIGSCCSCTLWALVAQFILEGQEEIGSPHLAELLKSHKKLLAADMALSADGGQISESQVGSDSMPVGRTHNMPG